jgi:putative SOS response-associated peptidase YedK
MCASYELAVDPEAIGRAFRVADLEFELPELSASRQGSLFGESERPVVLERFPRQLGLIVTSSAALGDARLLQSARFGLVPHFATSLAEGDKLYNARSETVHQRPMFRAAFARRRCLVPVSAFFEWQRPASVEAHGSARQAPQGRSQRYTFRPKQGGLLALAGIWDSWRAADGRKVLSFAILTSAPSALVAPIHSRMPVVLPFAQHELWLSEESDQELLRSLLVPVGDELLVALPG